MTALRAFLFAAFMYGSLAVLGILCLPLLLMPRSVNVGLVRWWTGLVTGAFEHIVGVRTVVKGREHLPDGPFILASKHQAMWETLKVNRLLDDPAIVLKKELMYVPLFGWWAKKLRMISVDRGAHAAALKKMLREAQTESDRGRRIVIFPEGTRAPVGGKNPYKPGVAAIYRALDVPVVPTALNSGRCWPRKGYGYRAGTITIEFLPPIEPGLNRKEFMAELESRIEAAADRLAHEPD